MLKALPLNKKLLFIFISVLWTSIFTAWVYQGYLWDCEHRMMGEQYAGPEAYYP